jgi:hypothetical protein
MALATLSQPAAAKLVNFRQSGVNFHFLLFFAVRAVRQACYQRVARRLAVPTRPGWT